MVRTGVVKHPCEWDICAYHEFYLPRQRYGIINIKRLLQVLGIPDIDKFREWHTLTLNKMLSHEFVREKFWSNAYAVGDEEWLKKHLESGGIKKMKIEETNGIKFATGKKLKFS